MAAGDAAQGETETMEGAMGFQCFQRVGGATGVKAATASGSACQCMKHGRENPPVEMDRDAKQEGHKDAC